MKKQPSTENYWYNQRGGAAAIAVAAALGAYGFGSRAIDTGSLWQYALTFGLIIVFLKELNTVVFRGGFKKRHG